MSERPLLPQAGTAPTAPPERADAARNRARILSAAERLFSERDPASVTMDDIAKAAGVGRGTLYRRYPDRAAIARALLDEHERALQEKLLRGAPPLGPGEPGGQTPSPGERLAAFYTEMAALLEAHLPWPSARRPVRCGTGQARTASGTPTSPTWRARPACPTPSPSRTNYWPHWPPSCSATNANWASARSASRRASRRWRDARWAPETARGPGNSKAPVRRPGAFSWSE